MEMAWSHPTEATLYHHQATFDLESSREAKGRSSTERLETFAGSRQQVDGEERDAQDRRLWREIVDGPCS